MADFQTVAGSKVSVSAAAPATANVAGFAALMWTEVGKLTSIGGVRGRTYATSTLSTIGDAQDREKKGSFKLPNAVFECAWDEDDLGQGIIQTGANNNSMYSFKVVKQDGKIRYFTAQIMEFVENNGTSNDIVKGSFTLLRQTDTISA